VAAGAKEALAPVTDQQDLPPAPPVKSKLPPAERRARRDERLAAIRLRVLIGQALEAKGIDDPTAIGAVFGLPPREADKLLRRHQWRDGDLARLKVAAIALGLWTSSPSDSGQ
jgi:hypothetical protein